MATAAMAAAKKTSSRKGGKGRMERISRAHNADAVFDFVTALESTPKLSDFQEYLKRTSATLGRVTRTPGARLLKVTLLDGTTDAEILISGTISFKGRMSQGKTTRGNCMLVNDLVVIDGGRATGKIPAELFSSIQTHFDRLGVSYPTGFFLKGTDTSAVDPTAMGYDWETDDAATMAALAKTAKKSTAGSAAADATEDDDDDRDFDIADI
jgi:hypothetical protein